MSTQTTGTATVPATQLEKTVADSVLNKVMQFERTGVINLPPGYSVANSLKFAWLQILQTVNKDKKPALEVCTQASIANSLLEMVIQGLNPMKKQCYFIVRGNKLNMSRSYMGSQAVAYRYGKIKEIIGQVIYEGDAFEYAIDVTTARKQLIKHEQKMENVDFDKIRGAYALTIYNDGTNSLETMTMDQIKKAWSMGDGYASGSKSHKLFTDEMCLKTIINRACKRVINSSDDTVLFKEEEEEMPPVLDTQSDIMEEIKENANLEELALEETNHEEIIIPQQEQKEVVEVKTAGNQELFKEEKKDGPNF